MTILSNTRMDGVGGDTPHPKTLKDIIGETIQVRRIGRATDPKPANEVWFTTQMQDLFVLDTDALTLALQSYITNKEREARIDELLTVWRKFNNTHGTKTAIPTKLLNRYTNARVDELKQEDNGGR